MEDIWERTLTGILSSLGTLLVIAATKKARSYLADRAVRRFWHFSCQRVCIVTPLYIGPEETGSKKNYSPNMARIENVIATYLLIELFKRLRKDYILRYDNEEPPADADLVLVGAPRGNKQSYKLRPKLLEEHRFPFDHQTPPTKPDMPFFLDRDTGTKYRSPLDTDDDGDERRLDLALVARVTERNPERQVFLLWGLHGLGTLGAAHFCTNRRSLRKIPSDAHDRECAFIIKGSFTNVRDVRGVTMHTAVQINRDGNWMS